MTPIEFKVHLVPVAKGRPRFGSRFGRVRIFTPEETRLFERAFTALARKHAPKEPLDIPLDIDLEFHFLRPASSKRKFHTVKPDGDNLLKSISDALNKLFYVDDAQIVRSRVTKFYSDQFFIRVLIREFTEESR